MFTPVSIKKVVNLFNPYEYTSDIINPPISLDEVEKMLAKQKSLINEPSVWTREKHIQRIVHFIYSRDNNPISINIGTPEKDQLPSNILTSGFHELAAAIYKKDEIILANLSGSEDALAVLFSLDIKKEKDNFFSWEIHENDLKDTWANEDFVLENIGNHSKVTQLASPDIWTSEFFEKIVTARSYNQLIEDALEYNQDLLINENLYTEFSKDRHTTMELWKQYVSDLYSPNSNRNSNIKNSVHKSTIKKIFNKTVLNNKECILKIFDKNLDRDSSSYQDIYPHLSSKLKLDKDILNIIYQRNKTSESYYRFRFQEHVPKEYFNDINNVISFLSTSYSGQDKHLISHFFNKREDIIKIFTSLEVNKYDDYAIRELFEALPKEIQKDKSLYKTIFEHNPFLFAYSPENIRKDIDLIETAFEGAKVHHYYGNRNIISKIPEDVYPQIRNEEIKQALIRFSPELLEKKCLPDTWEVKKEYLLGLGNDIVKVEFNKIKDYRQFLKDEDLVLQLINNNPRFLSSIPTKDRYKTSYVLAAISSARKSLTSDSSDFIRYLPAQMWLDKDFCCKAFTYDNNNIKYIPQGFFNNKDFILDFFKEVNASNISKVNEYLPKEVSHFITSFNIKDNYYDFFSKFFLSEKLQNNLTTTSHIKKSKI